MSENHKIAMWMFMVLDAFGQHRGYSRTQTGDFVVDNGIVHFLIDNYELLHYYDNAYVVQDIEDYLSKRKQSVGSHAI